MTLKVSVVRSPNDSRGALTFPGCLQRQMKTHETSISAAENKQCRRVMRKLMNMPCARMFVNPVDKQQAPDYDQRISEPICLEDIRRKLKERKYRRVKEWDSDMRLVLKNAREYNGRASLVSLLCEVMIKMCEKLRNNYLAPTMVRMTKQYCERVMKLDRLLRAHPNKPVFASFDALASEEQGTPMELSELQKRLSEVTENDYLIAILFLLRQTEPAYQQTRDENSLDVDLYRLQPETIAKLQKLALMANHE